MDSEIPNFGVRVTPKGVRTYFVRYRVGRGRGAPARRTALGKHPILTPEKARQRARDILAQARLGEDPQGDQTARMRSLTVSQLVNEWIDGPGKRTRKGKLKSAASFASDRARLLHHVVPTIGGVRLCDLTRAHVERVRDAVAGGKTAQPPTKTKPRGVSRVRGGEGVAARTVACLSTLLGYAVERGYLSENPARGVHRPAEKRCERFLSSKELQALQRALGAHEAKHPKAVSILRLLLLTGCRFNEIAGLRWEEFDAAHGVLRLRTSKTGARIVYLSPTAKRLLEKQPRIEGQPFVFPSAKGNAPYQGTPKVWRSVLKAAGLGKVRIHDLRHTFASTALAEGFSLEVIAKLLGHAEIRTTSRYAHLADAAVRAAVEKVASAVQRQQAQRSITSEMYSI